MRLFVENLEGRRLLSAGSAKLSGGTLTVRGDTTVANVISVDYGGYGDTQTLVAQIAVVINGNSQVFSAPTVKRINLIGGDRVSNTLSSSVPVPTTVSGGRLDDVITVPDVSVTVRAGDGNDRVTVVSTAQAAARKNAGVFIYGGKGNDTLTGGNRNDTIRGEDGDDFIVAGNGNNTLDGGNGNDTITAGSGVNRIHGGNGNDNLSAGTVAVTQSAQPVAVKGTKNELWGDRGNDTLTTGAGNDKLHGGSGNDSLFAGDGNDTLYGDAGDDRVDAGSGSNGISGVSGRDTLVASPASDQDRNRYYTNNRTKIEPAARKGIDTTKRVTPSSGDGFDFNPFSPF